MEKVKAGFKVAAGFCVLALCVAYLLPFAVAGCLYGMARDAFVLGGARLHRMVDDFIDSVDDVIEGWR